MFASQLHETTASPDGRRAGATWVAATGAFLLLAAAAVFVAVRWDQLPDAAKLALVGALTGGAMAGGRAIRRSLPATGDVLFHLGALLIPVDVAGLNLRLGLGWRSLLLAEGAVGVAALGALAGATGSVVLGWAAGAAMVALAAGVAAVSPVPAALVLAGAAAGAHVLRRHRLAVAWAAVAGLAPVLGAAVAAGLELAGADVGAGVLADLGLAGRSATLLAVVSSAVAAVVLGREAARRRDLGLVALAGLCLLSGGATTWVAAEPSADAGWLGAAALFLALEVVAVLCERDAFWRRPARAVALTAESAAGLLAPLAGLILLVAPLVEQGLDFFGDDPAWRPSPLGGVAWALAGGGWLLAGWRRHRRQPSPLAALRSAVGDDRTVVFLAAFAGAAVVVGTASTVAVAVALVAIGAALVASRGVLATVVAGLAAVWAPVVLSASHPGGTIPAGLAGAAVIAAAGLRWRHLWGGAVAAGLAGVATVVVLGSCLRGAEDLGVAAAMTAAVVGCWGVAAGTVRASAMAGHAARAGMAVAVGLAMVDGSATEVLTVAVAATLLFAIEALRLDDPAAGLGGGLTFPVVVGAAAMASGFDVPSMGVALCLGASVSAGLAGLTDERWRMPFLVAAGAGLLAGVPLAGGDEARLAEALMVAGGLGIGAGLATRSSAVGHAGGAVAILGLALHLVVDGVTASEAFAAPVALQLLVAGWQLRHRPDRLSSWVAYGPAIGLLGGAALAERLAGGESWHALVAGAVGVAAVAAGGWRRLIGPLFLGTGLVVAVTVIESLGTLAGVPTWAWLAAGGSTLLGVGVAMERTASTPLEAGRRLVDVIHDRYE